MVSTLSDARSKSKYSDWNSSVKIRAIAYARCHQCDHTVSWSIWFSFLFTFFWSRVAHHFSFWSSSVTSHVHSISGGGNKVPTHSHHTFPQLPNLTINYAANGNYGGGGEKSSPRDSANFSMTSNESAWMG